MWLCVLACACLRVAGALTALRAISVEERHRLFDFPRALAEADRLLAEGDPTRAAALFWHAILHAEGRPVRAPFEAFLGCFARRDEALLAVAEQYLLRGADNEGAAYLRLALEANPANLRAVLLLGERGGEEDGLAGVLAVLQRAPSDVEARLAAAHMLWERREHLAALAHFEAAAEGAPRDSAEQRSAFSCAVYLRACVCAWGDDGARWAEDMRMLALMLEREQLLAPPLPPALAASAVHPHMALAYPLPPALRMHVAASHARAELALVLQAGLVPYDHSTAPNLARLNDLASQPGFRLKVGYVSASIRSKAVLYLTQSLFGLHDVAVVEVHVFAHCAPDSQEFIREAMDGADWRAKVQATAEHFHDTRDMDVSALAALIRSLDIHVLVDWDGYSNNGLRPTGLLALQPAPLCVSMQEFLGSSGAPFVQYLVTDAVASPEGAAALHTEKLLRLPNCFFANSMPHLAPRIQRPLRELPPHLTPQRNGCGGAPASFVFCNLNKQLKLEPSVLRLWLQALERVPGSVLCLLESPRAAAANVMRFVQASNASLSPRVRFLPQTAGPWESHARTVSSCNAALDTRLYGSHTTAVDALWGGVPLLVWGDGEQLSARTGASMLHALGLSELVVRGDEEYLSAAVRLGTDRAHFEALRNRLVDTAHARPRNPLWDTRRYARNLERGFLAIWARFLSGAAPEHLEVEDVGAEDYEDLEDRDWAAVLRDRSVRSDGGDEGEGDYEDEGDYYYEEGDYGYGGGADEL